MKPAKTVLFHVDIDSPAVLARFWGLSENGASIDAFYERGMKRALDFFREFDVPATFFCVGRDLETSGAARAALRAAHEAGHEIANHTHTHFFSTDGMTDEALTDDIRRCSDAIRSVTGKDPVGFRAPGYAIGGRMMGLLRKLSFRYDSSAFWTPATSLMKSYHRNRTKASQGDSYGETTSSIPRRPYFPDAGNWQVEGSDRALLEIPLPRSPFFLTPFHNNFHLKLPDALRVLDVRFARENCLVYLFHLIEFCDLSDGVPQALRIHPNLSTPVAVKTARMRDTLRRLRGRYRVERTDRFAEGYRERAA